MKTGILIFLFALMSGLSAIAQQSLSLENNHVRLKWVKQQEGWVLQTYESLVKGKFVSFGSAKGEYSFIYSKEKPVANPLPVVENGDTVNFPEKAFKYVYPKFQRGRSAVALNKAGKQIFFSPTTAVKSKNGITFSKHTKWGTYQAVWAFDKKYPTDVHISITFKASVPGYYSLPTPTLAVLTADKLAWATVPGYFSGNEIQQRLPLAYAYGQGLPSYPILCRESTITTMSSILSAKNGLTMAVTPGAGQDRDPYEKDAITHDSSWQIALSHMNGKSQLSPTAYHPVLGERNSYVKAGETREFKFVVSLKEGDWYDAYKHVIYNRYRLQKSVDLKSTDLSLSNRLQYLYNYATDEKKALWKKEAYEGDTIAAQAYLGGVVGADKDAMKNSDIGAVWMLSKLTKDSSLNHNLLPYIRNFKIQQQVKDGFFKGAVQGQYYLAKSKKFTEEWGNHFEPIAITYYTMMDIGNMLLFEKNDKELEALLKNGAERLLTWQKEDGSWDLAYDRESFKPIYTDLKDLRPTFYGLMVAYELLKDEKYLKAAERGAQWYITNAVNKGHFVGVCGDARFVNDFATAQGAMALLDLYELTRKDKYLEAAVKTARMYTTSIYTHPIPTEQVKMVKGTARKDWQISLVGLNFEHGGIMGSAVDHGPILLTSHCSFFLKIFSYTKDSLFLDLARCAALGRDAFVNPDTKVASYYWTRFNEGAGPFPHHAWWQIGWIYDYLVAEAELRSAGTVNFKRGFMTPKVGPHKSLAFTAGTIEGKPVNLFLSNSSSIVLSNSNVDCLTALSEDGKSLFVILLNQQNQANNFTLHIPPQKHGEYYFKSLALPSITMGAFGIKILKIQASL